MGLGGLGGGGQMLFGGSGGQELFEKVQNLTRKLQPLSQGAFGYFTTKTRYAVSYQDVELRNRVQEELDHAVALLSIAHVMTIFEDNFPIQYWEEIINDTEGYDKLKAYKHIRNSTVQGFTGNRSENDEEYEYFDNVMSSDNPIDGVRSFNDKKIFLTESSGNYVHTFITNLTNKIIVEIHKRLY